MCSSQRKALLFSSTRSRNLSYSIKYLRCLFCLKQSSSVVIVKSCDDFMHLISCQVSLDGTRNSGKESAWYSASAAALDRPQLFIQDKARYCLLWNPMQLVSMETQQESCTQTCQDKLTRVSLDLHTQSKLILRYPHLLRNNSIVNKAFKWAVRSCCHLQESSFSCPASYYIPATVTKDFMSYLRILLRCWAWYQFPLWQSCVH